MTFTPGTSYSGFTLKQHQFVSEIKADVYLFEHDTLACPLLAIKNDDGNKTFSAAFNTIPTDSTGVAHILEHSVLMGSEKYPVKDVFGEINKGGLMTFLNAMTGSDITYYPFATRNLKEYFSIMDVYMDVVLNPLLARSTFEQEGWHYHQEGPDTPLQYQGVVYNEMKGAFSDPIRLIFHHIFGGLMPGSTYAHESGGDPQNIPDLSYEEFCAFHKTHYHPSNATFFVYGDAPLEEELRYLQDNFLSRFPQRGERMEVISGTDIKEITFIEDSYGVESSNTAGKTFHAVGTSVTTVLNREENAAFQIIANILYNSDASPLKNTIISNGLCKDFGGFYLSSSSFKTLMATYLVGSDPEKRDDFLSLYKQTLSEMVSNGLGHDLILSELNKYEFDVREEGCKAQRGLSLIGKAMPAFKYGTDPYDSLQIDELLVTIRHKALNENYFEKLIDKYLLNNPATVVVTLKPDPGKQGEGQAREAARLQEYAKSLDQSGQDKMIERTLELMADQQKPNTVETLSLLPQLNLDDLTPDIDVHQVQATEVEGCELLTSELPTDHISFIDIGFDISCLPSKFLPWLDLFGTIVTEIGTEKMDYMHFAREVSTCTGGFSHNFHCHVKKGGHGSFLPILWFQMKCLPEYQERAMHLLIEVFSTLSLKDRVHIREIVAREFAWTEHEAQSEGYSLATSLAFAHLSKAGAMNELISGVTTYRSTKELAQNYQDQEEDFLEGLQEMAQIIFNRNNLLLSITADEQELSSFKGLCGALITALPNKVLQRQDFVMPELPRHEALITSAEVVYAVQSGRLLPDGEGYNGHFEVLKTYLSRDYLWNTVRQMGGAYGCFIQFSHISGNFAVISYRDPQVRKTYDSYLAMPAIINGLDIPDEVLQQLVIGTYGNFTPLHGPASKGLTARNEYLSGITAEYKQQRISEIIGTSVNDLRSYAPAFEQMLSDSHRVIIGNRSKIEADSDLFDVVEEL
ncbi:MAG: insulinase family protein [Proteobacteria bacterium]|nr:insulinase family protein [Pseudomonadota bacterium]